MKIPLSRAMIWSRLLCSDQCCGQV